MLRLHIVQIVQVSHDIYSGIFSELCPCFVQDGDTGLFTACRQGYAVIVEMLLSNGAKVDFENSVRLITIVGIITQLLCHMHNYTQFGGTPLHAVSLSGYADIAEMLVDYGAVVDLQTEVKIKINGSWFNVSMLTLIRTETLHFSWLADMDISMLLHCW